MGFLEQFRCRLQKRTGKGCRYCRMCGNSKALIRKYTLNVCRQCFKENHENLGFQHLK